MQRSLFNIVGSRWPSGSLKKGFLHKPGETERLRRIMLALITCLALSHPQRTFRNIVLNMIFCKPVLLVSWFYCRKTGLNKLAQSHICFSVSGHVSVLMLWLQLWGLLTSRKDRCPPSGLSVCLKFSQGCVVSLLSVLPLLTYMKFLM